MLTVDNILAVALLYPVLTPLIILTYHILNTIIYLRVYIGHAAVPPHIYVHTPYAVMSIYAWTREGRVGTLIRGSYNSTPSI